MGDRLGRNLATATISLDNVQGGEELALANRDTASREFACLHTAAAPKVRLEVV